jgi:chemotaxis protein CheX
MTETEIKNFIKVLTDYFKNVTGIEASMGVPFIKENTSEVFDYIALIGISGSRKGGIYFTADKPLLEEFAFHILGERGLDDASLYDLVGEITNTIAGNMREMFGSSFLISVPIVLKGKIDEIVLRLKPPVYVIPVEWNNHKSYLAIGLE